MTTLTKRNSIFETSHIRLCELNKGLQSSTQKNYNKNQRFKAAALTMRRKLHRARINTETRS